MDNQFIFKYSWETLPKKWVKKWKDQNMGIALIPIRTAHFNCCAFFNCIPIQGFKFRSIFAELIIPLENEDLKWSIIYSV